MMQIASIMSATSDNLLEKLGQFYLGKHYDPSTKDIRDEPVLYQSKDLVTHGVVLGMTGSGKTGLCLALLEEAAMDNIPAIVIDPKGDISNLLLTFPDLDAKSFRPWINEDDAIKKGITPDAYAEQTASNWRQGLQDWGQSPDRIRQFRDQVDIQIFTPGSKAGIPVSILSSLEAPSSQILDDSELLGEHIESTVASLLSLIGISSETSQSPESVLLANLFQHAWTAGQSLTLDHLIRLIQTPEFDKIGVMDLESFMPAKARQELALRFNHLLASPSFSTWLEGAPLQIDRLLHTAQGKPRISIFSIAHLGDDERMFFVSLLLNQVLGWMRSQKGTTSLRALLYMDEIFGYLPPSANPPSKRPMMTILKQGRAFGLGTLLATQNPVDLDYKALSNIGTWFIGRLQTERDKLRVLDGLEGASGSQNTQFDRPSMERLLSSLGNRVFLMNNVHQGNPILFHVRWVMSYLTGPLSRTQIKTLMDPKRDQFLSNKASSAQEANPMAMPGFNAPSSEAARPSLGPGVIEVFATPPATQSSGIYKPYLLREANIHFSSTKAKLDAAKPVISIHPIETQGINWEAPVNTTDQSLSFEAQPTPGFAFTELPGYAMNAANYKTVMKDFAEWLYRNERAHLWVYPPLKAWSRLDESEGDFRTRMTPQVDALRDAAIADLKAKSEKKLQTLQQRLLTAQGQVERQQSEANAAKMQAGISVIGGIISGLLGKKSGLSSLSRSSGAIQKAAGAFKQHQDVNAAEQKAAEAASAIENFENEIHQAIDALTLEHEPTALVLETDIVKPNKSDIEIERVALLWLPCDAEGNLLI